jgi:hypothetical protein
MQTLIEIVEPIALILGSIFSALLLCWLLWRSFRVLHHPDWSGIAAVPAGVLALYATSPDHVFYRMVLAFTLVGALPLWIEGRAWSRRQVEPPFEPAARQSPAALPQPRLSRRYPIITSCIGEGRQPKHSEVRAVAARIWREGLHGKSSGDGLQGSFALRRRAILIARGALTGHVDGIRRRERLTTIPRASSV